MTYMYNLGLQHIAYYIVCLPDLLFVARSIVDVVNCDDGSSTSDPRKGNERRYVNLPKYRTGGLFEHL